jgi:hypothetical protein
MQLYFTGYKALDANGISLDLNPVADSFYMAPGIRSGINPGKSAGHFKIYPNPAADIITVSGTSAAERIEIYSVLGNCLYRAGNLHDDQLVVPIANLPSGVYLLKVSTAAGEAWQRFEKK